MPDVPPMSRPTRQRWTVGAVARVPLGEGHTYAQMLEPQEWAFFDARSADPLPAEEAAARPVLFRLWVMRSAYSTGRWVKVGVEPVRPELARPVGRFMYDMIGKRFDITTDGGATRRPATVAECRPLESAAVWSAGHVEDRLRDHYAGRPCKWVESMRRHLVAEPV